MNGNDRPIGWWLKEADARLDAAFDSALESTTVDRRGWQVLASLSRGPTPRSDLVTSLAAFDSLLVVDEVIDAMDSAGWIKQAGGTVSLSSAGAEQQTALAPLVDGVREQVTEALSQEQYELLVSLLSRLVAGLPPAI